jgi:hypothetical protein
LQPAHISGTVVPMEVTAPKPVTTTRRLEPDADIYAGIPSWTDPGAGRRRR